MNKDIKNIYFEEKVENKKLLVPDYYFSSVTNITPEFLNENKIKALILDVDNTLIDIDKNLDPKTISWAKELRGMGYKLFILSNTNKVDKVKKVADSLNIEYENLARKPFKSGFLSAQKKLGEKSTNIAAVGDQIFTDVLGANRCKMKTILVDPVDKRDYWYTAWKRPFENNMKKKFTKIK